MNGIGLKAGDYLRETGRLRLLGAATTAIMVVSACLAIAGFAPNRAEAAAPVIQNTSSTNSQTNWLQTFAISNDTGAGANRVYVTLTVSHDPGREVTGIKIDDNYDGTDNTASASTRAVTAQQANVVNGLNYSRVSYNYQAPTGSNGLECGNVFGGHVPTSTKPLRIRAVLDDGTQTATSSSNLRWHTYDCTGKDDYPYLKSRSPVSSSVNTGSSVTFTVTGDDSDSALTTNQTFGGINWRLRRLSDGVTTGSTKVCWGDSDNTARTFPVTFSRRGTWVVEAQLLNSNSSCGTNPNSDSWFFIGSVDVNAPASSSPELGLTATRPPINGNSVATATFNDSDDNGEGGRVQVVEWDLDQNTGNGVSGFEAVQLGDWKTGISSPQNRTINTTGMTPGLKTVRARVTDNGAMSAADNIRRTVTATTTFLVDTPPVALPDSLRTVTGEDLPLLLAGTDVDNDSLTYSITDQPDHGSLSGSGASRVYTPDPGYAGIDTFTFQVNDGYGGTGTADVSVRVDPDLTGFAGPSGTRDSRAGEIEFGSSVAGATFECQIDGAGWEACSSPWSLTDLEDGQHSMRARVTANGLTNPDVAETTWMVDAFPKIQINDGPPAESSSTGGAVDFSLNEVGATVTPTAECRLDGHQWTPCSSPVSFEDLDDGAHTISIRATDAEGKQSVETVSWSITTAGTQTSIQAPLPAAFGRESTATVQFNATGNVASFECSLDGATWDPCSSPVQLTGLTDGTHSLRVRAIDSLGTPEALPAQISWIVDRTIPVVTILSGPDGPIPAGPASFVFSSNESFSTFECKLDDGDYVACASPLHLPTGLADGPHAFRVAATDRAGNRSLAARRDFRVLSVAPEAILSGGPAQGEVSRSDTASFGFTTSTPVAGFECRVDGAGWAPCTSPAAMTGLPDGPHSFAVRAIDEVGNRSAQPTVRDWSVDTTAPETTITEGPGNVEASASATFRFSSSEVGSSFECSLDDAPFAACASPAGYAGLADGQHQLRVRATDAAGNRDMTPASRLWTIDTSTPPPPDPPDPPVQPGPCTFRIKQDRCDDPYLVVAARAPYRNQRGSGTLKVSLNSGGPALGRVAIRFAPGLQAITKSGKAGRRIGQVTFTGSSRTILPLQLPRVSGPQALVAGSADPASTDPSVLLRPRSIILERLPVGTTGMRMQIRSTSGLRIRTFACGTRFWNAALTDSSSAQIDVDTRSDLACIRKGSR